jgi:hypothetical protein
MPATRFGVSFFPIGFLCRILSYCLRRFLGLGTTANPINNLEAKNRLLPQKYAPF